MTETSLIINPSQAGALIQSNNLPKEMQGKASLTLDQIDARDVRVTVSMKKRYRLQRACISNNVICLLVHPTLDIRIAKVLLALAVEARRRLRHPDNQAWVTPIPGNAWGRLTLPADGKPPLRLIVAVQGTDVVTVTETEIAPKKLVEPAQ